MRILFFGDGAWATNSLLRLVNEGLHVVALVARAHPSDQALLDAARSLGIPCFQPEKVNAHSFVAQVRDLGPDLNLSISYDQIFRSALIAAAAKGSINFHAGKLPRYRGRNVINWAIINGESEIGLTAHYIDEQIDTGNLILQRTLPISWEDTYGDVLGRVVAIFPDFVREAVAVVDRGNVPRQPQETGVGTYFGKREIGDEWLDWTDTSLNLYNKIRAITHPGPGACTSRQGQTVTVWGAHYDLAWPKYLANPGQVVARHPGTGVTVKTGDSTLLLSCIQSGDEPEQVPSWPIGTRLGINILSYLQDLESRIRLIEAKLRGE